MAGPSRLVRRAAAWSLGILFALGLPAANAGGEPVLGLRLVPLRDGLREEKGRIAGVEGHAKDAGVDLERPDNPLLVARCREGHLFYLFYKTVENALGDRPWLVQRIRKTERTWGKAGSSPEVRVTYLVEAFKTLGGSLKKADQHDGWFGLRDAVRREIHKECEIGFGVIPGVAEGKEWPFDEGRLYREIQDYQEDRGAYDRVRFSRARRWTLTAAFDAGGEWRLASPELGFDAPKRMPDPAAAKPEPNPRSKDLVLVPGKGVGGLLLGTSRPEDLARQFGEPLEVARMTPTSENRSVAASLTINFDGSGTAHTVITRTDFAGATDKGVRLWATRDGVRDAHGPPPGDQKPDAGSWIYPGILFVFDGLDRVWRIVLTR